jgi:hypothetical protein
MWVIVGNDVVWVVTAAYKRRLALRLRAARVAA